MFGLLKRRPCSIGVDVGSESIRLIQLAHNGKGMKLIAGRNRKCPPDIVPGSSEWQRWAIQTMKIFVSNGGFKGKTVTATVPPADLFIDHVRIHRSKDEDLEEAAFAKIKQKLPFEPNRDNVVLKCVRTGEDNVLVMAAERKIIDRHLAIYEQANLKIKTIAVWPVALVNCYTRFFGRRQSDLEAVVMLASIETDRTNVVICRHKHLLYARSIPIGALQLEDENVISRFVLELTGARRQFTSMHRNVQIERLIFLAGRSVKRQTCAAVAKQLEMPAQMGDCLAAVQITDPYRLGIDRRSNGSDNDTADEKLQVNWAAAFGLSLSE